MSLEESRRTQRPYRYGMILLCVGALVNWLGLAEEYSEPIRYTGVACILAGACLICTAMCCWLHTPNRSGSSAENDDPVHTISAAEQHRCEKPPDYDSVALPPPSYDDAIKLDPAALLHLSTSPAATGASLPAPPSGGNSATTPSSAGAVATSSSASPFSFAGIFGRASSNEPDDQQQRNATSTTAVDSSSPAQVSSFHTENEKPQPHPSQGQQILEKPPPYDASPAPPPPAIVAALPVQLNPAIVVPGSN